MSKYEIVILHGTFSHPRNNWFQWLKKELQKDGHKVFVPKFPTPKNQTIKSWIRILDKKVGKYDKNTILVGHSSSPLVICAKLQELEKPIKACFVVAPFKGDIGVLEYDKANSNFSNFNFKWGKIRKMAKFYIYRSNDDPYVPKEKGKILSKKLKIKEILIPKGGHLNAERGYTKFPQLLKDIREEIKRS